MNATSRHRLLAPCMAAILGLAATSAPAAAYELWFVGLYCASEAQHSIGSDSDETFLVVTVYDNATGDILAPPRILPTDGDGQPTQWNDVDAGEFRDTAYRLWSGGERDLYIDIQTWEFDNHGVAAFRVLVDFTVGVGIGFATANPFAGAAAGVVANEIGGRIFSQLDSGDHDFLGSNAIVIDAGDMAAWATHKHYNVQGGGTRIDFDFSAPTTGRGADYEIYFDISG